LFGVSYHLIFGITFSVIGDLTSLADITLYAFVVVFNTQSISLFAHWAFAVFVDFFGYKGIALQETNHFLAGLVYVEPHFTVDVGDGSTLLEFDFLGHSFSGVHAFAEAELQPHDLEPYVPHRVGKHLDLLVLGGGEGFASFVVPLIDAHVDLDVLGDHLGRLGLALLDEQVVRHHECFVHVGLVVEVADPARDVGHLGTLVLLDAHVAVVWFRLRHQLNHQRPREACAQVAAYGVVGEGHFLRPAFGLLRFGFDLFSGFLQFDQVCVDLNGSAEVSHIEVTPEVLVEGVDVLNFDRIDFHGFGLHVHFELLVFLDQRLVDVSAPL